MNTELERKSVLILADELKGEINRMCVTNDISELNSMELFAGVNLKKLYLKKLSLLHREGGKDG